MPSFCAVTILGNMTRDVETRQLQGGSTVGSFGVAVNRKYKTSGGEEREDVLFLDCEAWNKAAELLAQYTQKGDPIFLHGRLALDQWDDQQTGAKRSKHKLVVDQFQFLKGKSEQEHPRDNGNQTGGGYDTTRRQQPRGRAPSQRPQREGPFGGDPVTMPDADSDGIPFTWSGRTTQPL